MKHITILLFAILSLSAYAVVDDAHSRAMEVAAPYVKKGFDVRQEYWSGFATPKQQNYIQHQLSKGNQYWFWLASDEDAAVVSVHVYDGAGNLVDAEAWSKGNKAAVRVVPKHSGTYYILFQIEDSKLKRTRWALAYGFK